VRSAIPDHMPLFFRISALDGSGSGWSLEDSAELARQLKLAGVDVIDCSSGGMRRPAPSRIIPRHYGFQVPFAEAIRRGADLPTVAVGMIVDPRQGEAILRQGKADIIGIGRAALENPQWTLHAQRGLTGSYDAWPAEYRSSMERRDAAVAALTLAHKDFEV
jgi:2,4-dienoyl-CoA reductase-like NADH-dependent reductase (Old Yellow Enzyme family)